MLAAGVQNVVLWNAKGLVLFLLLHRVPFAFPTRRVRERLNRQVAHAAIGVLQVAQVHRVVVAYHEHVRLADGHLARQFQAKAHLQMHQLAHRVRGQKRIEQEHEPAVEDGVAIVGHRFLLQDAVVPLVVDVGEFVVMLPILLLGDAHPHLGARFDLLVAAWAAVSRRRSTRPHQDGLVVHCRDCGCHVRFTSTQTRRVWIGIMPCFAALGQKHCSLQPPSRGITPALRRR